MRLISVLYQVQYELAEQIKGLPFCPILGFMIIIRLAFIMGTTLFCM